MNCCFLCNFRDVTENFFEKPSSAFCYVVVVYHGGERD
jgi:hypothetical protein